MVKDVVAQYLDLNIADIQAQLLEISARQFPEPGRRQVPFVPVETILCYGLFFILDPHRYGGGNIDRVPPAVNALAAFFHRTPGSITNKMLNLDGSRANSARAEPMLFALLSAEPVRYKALYSSILEAARRVSIGENLLPDFLDLAEGSSDQEVFLGQEELPSSLGALLVGQDQEMNRLEQDFSLGDELTEKLAEGKVRLGQHRFAHDVLQNCNNTCVFCGYEPRSLPMHHGLLRASHIKPWAASVSEERLDLRNGLAACPIHDAAFDQGYLSVNKNLAVLKSGLIIKSLEKDRGADLYFGDRLRPVLLLPPKARSPRESYLAFHREKIFKG